MKETASKQEIIAVYNKQQDSTTFDAVAKKGKGESRVRCRTLGECTLERHLS